MDSETHILYIADPMCSWCWGFAPVLAHLEAKLPHMPVRIILGGLAEDCEEPMEESMRQYIQQAWRDVGTRTGAEFNFDFWSQNAPRRSTWPACRAVVLARKQGLEHAMFRAIQRAYYLEAKNPSDDLVLAQIAEEVGMDRAAFLVELNSPATQAALEADFEIRRSIGAQSFPSLGLQRDAALELVHSGWCDPKTALRRIVTK